MPAIPPKARRAPKVPLVRLVPWGRKVLRVDHLGLWVRKAPRVRPVRRGPQGRRAPLVRRARQVPQGRPVRWDRWGRWA